MSSISPDAPGYVRCEVLAELVWVLERAHKYPRVDGMTLT